MRPSIVLVVLVSLAVSALSSAQAQAPSPERADAVLRQVERRSLQLARLVSSQLDRARTHGRQGQARCLDAVLSQVHAVQRHATWHLERAGAPEAGRRVGVARVLSERLERLGHEQRRCLGTQTAQRTEVTVEIAPWVPRGEAR